MSVWSPEGLESDISVSQPYLARLKSKRRAVRTCGIGTTRWTFQDRIQGLLLG
ncbi:hypothetical protein LINPERPRIM_LOCUS41268 [Linum perenne]